MPFSSVKTMFSCFFDGRLIEVFNMNKVLIIDASETDGRIMSRLLIRAGYDPVKADNIETGRIEAAKLPPGAVIENFN